MGDADKRSTGAEGVSWDLSDLYSSPVDPRMEADCAEADRRALAFASRYKGRVCWLTAGELRALLEEYEEIAELGGKAGVYAMLSWATDSADPARGALLQRLTERSSRRSQELVFLDIEWANAPEEQAEKLISGPLLARWRHYLETSRRLRPHLLSEPEERLLQEKSVTGRSAWVRYFDELHGAASYEWEGGRQPAPVVLARLHDPDRDMRRRAAASLTAGLTAALRSTTYVFNTVLADKASDDRLRSFPTWISERNLDNQVEDATVDALVTAVTSRYDVVARYYRLKQRLLGLDELFDFDRYAPLPAAERSYSWDDAQGIVLSAFQRFHPRMGEIAALFFKKGWIDAAVRPAKRGGAFCHSAVPSVHPYVLTSYLGRSEDVMTVAHELGHGVHQYLARERGILAQNTPLTTAETASIFGESLVFEDLFAREPDPAVKLAMLVREIEGSFATVFRQIAMNRFEEAAHNARRTEGELPSGRIGELWLATQRAMFGGSVTLTGDYGVWWSYIPHFLHTPGYVYAYAFGDLLVRALFDRYLSSSDGFAETYLDMLAAGGSDWPHHLLTPLGVDLTDPGFWRQGLGRLEAMVDMAEELSAQGGMAARG
jgi:oligoendopeptidase F